MAKLNIKVIADTKQAEKQINNLVTNINTTNKNSTSADNKIVLQEQKIQTQIAKTTLEIQKRATEQKRAQAVASKSAQEALTAEKQRALLEEKTQTQIAKTTLEIQKRTTEQKKEQAVANKTAQETLTAEKQRSLLEKKAQTEIAKRIKLEQQAYNLKMSEQRKQETYATNREVQAEKQVSAAREKAIAQIDKIGKSTQSNSVIYQKHNNQILGLAKSFMQWQVAATLVMQPIYKTKQALESLNQTLVKTESTVIALKRVLNEDIANQQISDELYNIGIAYGQSFENVSEIATNFARSGKSWADTIELTKGAVLALNVAELDASEASDGLIAIMAQFNLKADETVNVIDKLNKTADNFPVTTEKLLRALQRTGSAAVNANLDINETIGVITALSKATGRSGENIGTAVNALLQYSAKADALDVFASLSEDTAKVVDLYRTGAANMLDVWKSVSSVIKNADERQKDILNTFTSSEEITNLGQELHDELGDIFEQTQEVYGTANTFRKNYFIALLDNMDTVTEAIDVASNAAGYSAKENAEAMDTYERRAQALQTQWQKIANDEQGILALKKSIVGLGADILTVINNAGGLKTALLPLSAIFAPQIAKGAMSLVNGITKVTQVTKLATKATALATTADIARTKAEEALSAADTAHRIGLASTERQLLLYKVAEEEATLATEAQTAADEAAAAAATAKAMAIQGAFALIGIALMVGMKLYSNYRENLKKTAEQTEETAKKSIEAANQLSEIKTAMDNGTKSSDELRTAFVEQQKAMGKTDVEINKLINSYTSLKDAINATAEAQLKKAYTDSVTAREAQGTNLMADLKNSRSLLTGNNYLLANKEWYGNINKSSVQEYQNIYDKYFNATTPAEQHIELDDPEKWVTAYNELYDLLQKLNEEGTNDNSIFSTSMYKSVAEAISKIEETINGYTDSVDKAKDALNAFAKIKFTNEFGEELLDSSKDLSEYTDKINDLSGISDEVKEAMIALATQSYNTDKAIREFANGAGLTEEETKALIQGIQALINTGASLETATYEQIKALVDEGVISIDTANKILQLQIQTSDLSTAAGRANFQNLVNQILNTGTAAARTVGILTEYTKIMAILGNTDLSTLDPRGASALMSRVRQLEKAAKDAITNDNNINLFGNNTSKAPTVGGGGSSGGGSTGGSSGGSSGKASDPVQETIDAYKELIDLLKLEYDLLEEQDAPLREKLDKLGEIQEQLHKENEYLREQDIINGKDTKEHLAERLQNSKEWLEWEKKRHSITEQIYKDELSLYDSELSILSKQENKGKERIDILEYQKEVLHAQAEYLRSIGAEQEEINKLSAKWLELCEEIEDIRKDYWNELEKAVEKELENSQKIRDELIAEQEAEKEALDKKRENQEETNELLEKEKSLREALIALEEARNQRNVRVYNESSSKWEWQANRKDVENAINAYDSAAKSLKEYREELAYNEAIEKIDKNIKNINNAYDRIEQGWKQITDSMQEPVRDITSILDDIAKNGTPKMQQNVDRVNNILASIKDFNGDTGTRGKSSSKTEAAIAQMKENSSKWSSANSYQKVMLNLANKGIASMIGATYNSEEGAYYKDGKRLYDTGGILNGMGGIKATNKPEAVLDPELTRQILNPVSNSRFTEFAKSLGVIFNEQQTAKLPIISKALTSGNYDNRTYSINGVPITKQMAETYTAAELFNSLNLV